ncbi:MAG: hypothetical protein KC592_18915 [Nitrospira sp.]|nr:hypothetical protein [Nitrospira sp.]
MFVDILKLPLFMRLDERVGWFVKWWILVVQWWFQCVNVEQFDVLKEHLWNTPKAPEMRKRELSFAVLY